MMDRTHIYAVIEGEIAYQDAAVADPARPDIIESLSAGEHLLAMEHCLAEARNAWYKGSFPHTQAAENIRKVTALGVRFMERFSAPYRHGAGE